LPSRRCSACSEPAGGRDLAEIARRLREAAGLPKQPTGVVANDGQGLVEKVRDKVT
jgi:hypothetical protein